MLREILALRADALGSKFYPVYSGSLSRATELPAGTMCLPATSSSRALVHPRSHMHHLSDAFHKVRKSVSLHRISSKHVELPKGCERKKGRNVLSSKI